VVEHPHLGAAGVRGDREGVGPGADRGGRDDSAAERVDHDDPVERVVLLAEHADVGAGPLGEKATYWGGPSSLGMVPRTVLLAVSTTVNTPAARLAT
jgi:hypothetical protein